MPFMQKQITNEQDWYELDTNEGTVYVPAEMVGDYNLDNEQEYYRAEKALETYCNADTIYTIQKVSGFGARLSASGYTDATEWSVHSSYEDADEYLNDLYELELEDEYGDDDEDKPEIRKFRDF